MQRTENNFYRVVLQEVYQYPKYKLELMMDDECEKHYEFLQDDHRRLLH